MRFLFVTLQFVESDFYAEVASELAVRGHDVAMVAMSPRAATKHRDRMRTYCMLDLVAAAEPRGPVAEEAARVEARYTLPTLRDAYRTDRACFGRSEAWSLDWAVRHFAAMEKIFDAESPDVMFLDVGGEMLRTAAHEVALARGVTVLFPFYTIFPRPLRLHANTMQGPIVTPDEIRPLRPEERGEVETFIAEFTERAQPIREYRRSPSLRTHWRNLVRHVAIKLTKDRDNPYLRPMRWIRGFAIEAVRRRAVRMLYQTPRPGRPYVYFPLHVTDDYKIARLIPHCTDQASILAQVAQALPAGYDLVVKEHPMAIGRTPISEIRRLTRIRNLRLVAPETSSHELIKGAEAVVVISSTVGLEALLYAKPVLTIGRPFYASAGVTLDVDSFAELREGVPALLRLQPDREQILQFLHAAMRRCHPGAPVLVDRGHENALVLAGTLDRVVREASIGATGIEHVVEESSAWER